MENKISKAVSWFKKSLGLEIHRKREQASKYNKNYSTEDMLEAELISDITSKAQYLHTVDDVMSVAMRTVLSKINSFEIKGYISDSKGVKEYLPSENIISKLLYRPNKHKEKTIKNFNNVSFTYLYSMGIVYFLFDAVLEEITTVDQRNSILVEINSFNLRNFNNIPEKVQLQISTTEDGIRKTEYKHFYYDFESGVYISNEDKDLFLFRIIDNRFLDDKYKNTSIVSSCAKPYAVYNRALLSLASILKNASHFNFISSFADDIQDEEKMQGTKREIENIGAGVANHGNTVYSSIRSKEGQGVLNATEVSSLPKNSILFDLVKQNRVLIFQVFGIPEQLVEGANAHYDSRDSADVQFSIDIHSLMQNFYDELAININAVLKIKERKDYNYRIEIVKLSTPALLKSETDKFDKFRTFFSTNEIRKFLNAHEKQGAIYDEILTTTMQMPLSSDYQNTDSNNLPELTDEKSLFDSKESLFEYLKIENDK